MDIWANSIFCAFEGRTKTEKECNAIAWGGSWNISLWRKLTCEIALPCFRRWTQNEWRSPCTKQLAEKQMFPSCNNLGLQARINLDDEHCMLTHVHLPWQHLILHFCSQPDTVTSVSGSAPKELFWRTKVWHLPLLLHVRSVLLNQLLYSLINYKSEQLPNQITSRRLCSHCHKVKQGFSPLFMVYSLSKKRLR